MRHSLRQSLGAALAASLCAAALAGCDVRTPPRGLQAQDEGGFTKIYAAPPAHVEKAAGLALDTLGLRWQGASRAADGALRIPFEQPAGVFTFGALGMVEVLAVPGGAAATVRSERRVEVEFTGTNERQFADRILREIESQLGRWPQDAAPILAAPPRRAEPDMDAKTRIARGLPAPR